MAVTYPLLHRLGGFHWWAVLFPCRVQWFGRVIGGRFYSLAGVNGSGVSLGEMSGNDIAMSGGEMWAVSPIPCFIGSVASIGGRLYFLAGCQWFGCVIGGGSIPLQVRAVVAMVKFSHLTNFVLNKKLGCIIQNCSLGGCVPRWLCGVSSRVDVGRW